MSKQFSQFNMLNNYQKLYTNNKDMGYNVIINKDNIQDPPNLSKRKDLYFVNNSNNLMNKINNKNELTEDDVLTLYLPGRHDRTISFAYSYLQKFWNLIFIIF